MLACLRKDFFRSVHAHIIYIYGERKTDRQKAREERASERERDRKADRQADRRGEGKREWEGVCVCASE